MEIKKQDDKTTITLSEIELTVFFATIEQKSASAKKSIVRMAERSIEYKNKFAKIRNVILVDWQETIDEYVKEHSNEIVNRMYKGSDQK